MRGLNNPFPAQGADDVHRQFGLGPLSLLLGEEAPWKKGSDCSELSARTSTSLTPERRAVLVCMSFQPRIFKLYFMPHSNMKT